MQNKIVSFCLVNLILLLGYGVASAAQQLPPCVDSIKTTEQDADTLDGPSLAEDPDTPKNLYDADGEKVQFVRTMRIHCTNAEVKNKNRVVEGCFQDVVDGSGPTQSDMSDGLLPANGEPGGHPSWR